MSILVVRLAVLAAVWLPAPSIAAPDASDYVRRSGNRLVVGRDAREVLLRGVAMFPGQDEPPSEPDYAAVRALGANTIRLVFGYRRFYDPAAPERYKDAAWEWLDGHVGLARRHDLHLVLQLCDVEGAQFVPVAGKPFDYRIWEDPRLQERFVGLWRAIARRYAHEPRIAGFSLFCEPVVSRGVEQWASLARRTVAEIRKLDRHHLLLVERIYGENGVRREVSGVDLPPERAFFTVPDDNVAYEFYFFDRDEYTHQFAPWRSELKRSLAYPDPQLKISYREEPGGLRKQLAFDHEYLRFYLRRQTEFGKKNGVPMVVWAFGLLRGCFEAGKGGRQWLEDVTRLLNEEGLHWTVWVYRDPDFGIEDNAEARAALAQALRRPVPADHHVHVLGPGLLRDWKALGVPFSRADEVYTSAGALLEQGAVARAALVPMAHLYGRPGFSQGLGLTLEQEHARVREENDHVAREAARYPGRAIAFCSVGLLRPYAWQEIRRCRKELRSPGLKLHLAAAGTDLRDEHLQELERIAAWAEAERVALLLHFDPQRRGLERSDVERFIQMVLEPHPRLEAWIAHLGGSGGYGPWTQSVLGVFADWLERQPAGARPGLYFDLSAVVLEKESEGVPPTTAVEAQALARDLRRIGLERVVFGSDYPVFDPGSYASLLAARAGLDPAELSRLLQNLAPVLPD